MTDITSRTFREGTASITSLLRYGLGTTDHPEILTGLLILKRLADRKAEQESKSGDLVGFLAYAPAWEEITAAESPGTALTAAFSRLEKAHPGEKWFADLVFNPEQDELWKEIVAKISEFSFRDAGIGDDRNILDDVVFRPYRRGVLKRGHIEASRPLARFLAALLAPEAGMSVYNPFCDRGLILAEAAGYARERGGGGVTLFTQAPTDYSRQVTALALLLHNCPEAHIATGSVIGTPAFVQGRRVMRFDRVVGIVPPVARHWEQEASWPDPYLRFIYGTPPSISGDAAYLSHAIASLADGGRLATVVPGGVLFRTTKGEKAFREAIVNEDLVEAVIALPSKTVIGGSADVSALVISNQKPEDRQGRVVFIDDFRSPLSCRSPSILCNEETEAVLDAYTSFKEIEGFSAVATTDEIAENDFTLEVSRYVLPVEEKVETIDLDATLADLEEVRRKKAEALDRFLASVARLKDTQR